MTPGLTTVFASIPWFGWVAIVAIISGAISGMLQMRYSHLERIEMIRQGMHPDQAEASVGKPMGVEEF